MSGLYDKYNRKIDYLRISITDRCNLRCFYCMPLGGVKPKPHDEILSYEEIKSFAKAAVNAGVSKIKLTGGEPLVRKGAVKLVSMLAGIPGLKDISLTTNGTLLPEFGERLKAAGLKRVNISIDSLDPQIYQIITRMGKLERVLSGLEKSLELGFEPVKINTVLIRSINDDPKDFIKLIYDYPVHVRFIELMPVSRQDPSLFLSIDELKQSLIRYGNLKEIEGPEGAGPAQYVTFKGALGSVGFISPISHHFCSTCNRLRLTSDGKLRTCLFSDKEFDIRPIFRDKLSEEEISAFIQNVLNRKPEGYNILSLNKTDRLMCQIGG